MRISRKVSQEELAFKADLDRTYISLLERGLRNPTLRIIMRLAEVLEKSASEMIALMESHLKHHPKQVVPGDRHRKV